MEGLWKYELKRPLSEYLELDGIFYKNMDDIVESCAEHGNLACGVSNRSFESTLNILSWQLIV